MSAALPVARQQCLVCSSPNKVTHFGMEVCRACANFFKRAQAAGRRIQCRNGDRQCTAIRGKASLCRGCRYDRCLEIGLSCRSPVTEDALPNCIVTAKVESLLDRITKEHAIASERQRVREFELVRRLDLKRVTHPSEELYRITFESVTEVFNLRIDESWKLFFSIFPALHELALSERREIFRHCMPHFGTVVSYCYTKKLWGGFDRYFMCSQLLCADSAHPEAWMGHHAHGPMKEELIESIRGNSEDRSSLVVPSFEKSNIRERELHALLALILCESEIAERYQSIIDSIRKQILKDLHHFYTQDMKLAEYSTRLGNLFTICHTCREVIIQYREFFRTQVTVFDLYANETTLKELFL